jgi:hypothetical protein
MRYVPQWWEFENAFLHLWTKSKLFQESRISELTSDGTEPVRYFGQNRETVIGRKVRVLGKSCFERCKRFWDWVRTWANLAQFLGIRPFVQWVGEHLRNVPRWVHLTFSHRLGKSVKEGCRVLRMMLCLLWWWRRRIAIVASLRSLIKDPKHIWNMQSSFYVNYGFSIIATLIQMSFSPEMMKYHMRPDHHLIMLKERSIFKCPETSWRVSCERSAREGSQTNLIRRRSDTNWWNRGGLKRLNFVATRRRESPWKDRNSFQRQSDSVQITGMALHTYRAVWTWREKRYAERLKQISRDHMLNPKATVGRTF